MHFLLNLIHSLNKLLLQMILLPSSIQAVVCDIIPIKYIIIKLVASKLYTACYDRSFFNNKNKEQLIAL